MLSAPITLARVEPAGLLLIAFACLLTWLLFYAVHCGLDYCCLRHARSFCRKRGLEVERWRLMPAFDQTGLKTEFSLVELDCLDRQRQRRLVRLHVWLFGIRKVLGDEQYPELPDAPAPDRDGEVR